MSSKPDDNVLTVLSYMGEIDLLVNSVCLVAYWFCDGSWNTYKIKQIDS